MTEVVVLLAMVVVLAMLLLPAMNKAGKRSWMGCFTNLKQLSLGFNLFANDHEGQFPMKVSTNAGGTMELVQSNIVVFHFQALSNIIGTPKILACSQDTNRNRGTFFEKITSRNVSYLLNVDSAANNTGDILVADDNLSVIPTSDSGFLYLTPISVMKWQKGRHSQSGFLMFRRPVGHVAFVDGSVRRMDNKQLREIPARLRISTNLLVKPDLNQP